MKKQLLTAACLVLAGSAHAALVANFTFDGDATNTHGPDGTETGSVSYVAGKFGQAASLDAANDSIDLGSTTLGGIGTGDFTVSLWVNLNNNTVSGDPAFFSNKDWDDGTNTGLNYAVKSSGNLDVNTYGGTRVDFEDNDTSDLSASGWDNIILVRSGNSMSYYFNGTAENSSKTITAGADFESTLNFVLGDDGTGAYNGGNSWSADMLFDDLAVWKEALDQSQITALQTNAAAAVPEPSAAALLGLAGLALMMRRGRK